MNGVIDSSIWKNNYTHEVSSKKDQSIRIGMVREAIYDETSSQTKYVVEVFDRTTQVPVVCVKLDRFGGAFNYEEYTHQTNVAETKNLASGSKYSVRPGDVVLICYANGDSREGFILGGIKHPARKEKVSNKDNGIAYRAEFNGIETHINKSGEYKLTFKGIPTNISALSKPPNGNDIPEPIYDTSIGSSYMLLDKTGSLTISDSAKSKIQSIKVDKPNGKIVITSGDVTLTMDKNSQLLDIKTKDMKVVASNSIVKDTKEFSLIASTSTKIKSPKVAIGTDAVELLDQLVKLIDALSKVIIFSPVGPCATFGSSGQWPDVDKIKSNINTIKGSL